MKKDLASTLGVSLSQITRWLSAPGNWTLDTVSDILFSIGGELEINIAFFSDATQKRGNYHHKYNNVNGQSDYKVGEFKQSSNNGIAAKAAFVINDKPSEWKAVAQ